MEQTEDQRTSAGGLRRCGVLLRTAALDAVLAALGWLLGILAPFLLGGALAFILNVPMRAIERHLFPRNRKGAKLRRPLALVLTLVAVIGVLALAGLVIGPGIADAVMSIIREIPAAFQRLEHQLTALAENCRTCGLYWRSS